MVATGVLPGDHPAGIPRLERQEDIPVKRLSFWKRPYFARRILDVGAGHNPFKGVTHVLEIDSTQGGQRGWNKLLVPESSKLIVGDTTALPFQSGSFDYVYAAHVLEHVD